MIKAIEQFKIFSNIDSKIKNFFNNINSHYVVLAYSTKDDMVDIRDCVENENILEKLLSKGNELFGDRIKCFPTDLTREQRDELLDIISEIEKTNFKIRRLGSVDEEEDATLLVLSSYGKVEELRYNPSGVRVWQGDLPFLCDYKTHYLIVTHPFDLNYQLKKIENNLSKIDILLALDKVMELQQNIIDKLNRTY